MKTLKLNAMERHVLKDCLPAQAPLTQVAIYLRIIEALRIKEDEYELIGATEDQGTIHIEQPLVELEVVIEDADLSALMVCVDAYELWPVAEPVMVLMEKLNKA